MKIESKECKIATSKLLLKELEKAVDHIFYHLDTMEQNILLCEILDRDITPLEDIWDRLKLTTKIFYFGAYYDKENKPSKKKDDDELSDEEVTILLFEKCCKAKPRVTELKFGGVMDYETFVDKIFKKRKND